jgi:FkbM family methyltransferase
MLSFSFPSLRYKFGSRLFWVTVALGFSIGFGGALLLNTSMFSAESDPMPPELPYPPLSNVLRLANYNCQTKEDLIKHLGGEAVVIEVGAFDGAETITLAENAKEVYSFEASPAKESTIRAKISALSSKIHLQMAAVGDVSGTAKLSQPSGVGNINSQTDALGDQRFWTGEVPYIEVPVVRLDDIVHKHVDMLKVDTQGHEFAVIRGAEGIMKNYGIDLLHLEFSPRLMESSGDDPAKFLQWLSAHNYVCMDCAAFSVPEDMFSDRNFEEFPKSFGDFIHGKGNHGAWTDILCYRAK